jgi:hypothetical protein
MRIVLLSVVLLCGCATKLVDIDYSNPPPDDWPKLEERVTYGTVEEVQDWCLMPAAVRKNAFNCALLYFQHGVCMIYLTHRPIQGALEHERAHCRGYDHIGDTNRSRNAWEQWKKSNPR